MMMCNPFLAEESLFAAELRPKVSGCTFRPKCNPAKQVGPCPRSSVQLGRVCRWRMMVAEVQRGSSGDPHTCGQYQS